MLFNILKLCRSIEIETAEIFAVDNIKKHIVIKIMLRVKELIGIISPIEFIRDLSMAKYMQTPSKSKYEKSVLKTYMGLEKYFFFSLFKSAKNKGLFL